jgi:hypothetical protein
MSLWLCGKLDRLVSTLQPTRTSLVMAGATRLILENEGGPMAREYPWYEVVEGDHLEQGDLLRACPVLVPVSILPFPLADHSITADLRTFDVVVMTQSCDLANDKTEDIILCPHWDLIDASRMDVSLARRSVQLDILKGRIYRYAMLAASADESAPIGVRIVDFGRIFSLPKAFLRQFAAGQGRRLRLAPPYREHLSQAFARFFMRVGLPEDIRLPT